MRGTRGWDGTRPFVRTEGVSGVVGFRLARRKGWGESLAKVVRWKERDVAIVGKMRVFGIWFDPELVMVVR